MAGQRFWSLPSSNDKFIGAMDPNFGGCGRTLTDENGFIFSVPLNRVHTHGVTVLMNGVLHIFISL